MATSLTEVNWGAYVKRFLDQHSFADGKQAAAAIAVQSVADHGPGSTLMLELQTIAEWNRRDDAARHADFLADYQAGARSYSDLSQDERNEFANSFELGVL